MIKYIGILILALGFFYLGQASADTVTHFENLKTEFNARANHKPMLNEFTGAFSGRCFSGAAGEQDTEMGSLLISPKLSSMGVPFQVTLGSCYDGECDQSFDGWTAQQALALRLEADVQSTFARWSKSSVLWTSNYLSGMVLNYEAKMSQNGIIIRGITQKNTDEVKAGDVFMMCLFNKSLK